MPQNDSIILLFFHIHTFTMVEENFKIRLSETPRLAQFYYFSVVVILSPWLKKILKIDFLKRPEWLNSTTFLWYWYFHHVWRKFWNSTFWNTLNGLILLLFCHSHTFTMVEENFEIRLFETPHNDSILLLSVIVYLHHGWRKFWNFTFWNALEWLNSTTFLS